MNKNNLISVNFDENAIKKIQELIDHYECELYEKGLDYSKINSSLVINYAIDKLHYDLIIKNERG